MNTFLVCQWRLVSLCFPVPILACKTEIEEVFLFLKEGEIKWVYLYGSFNLEFYDSLSQFSPKMY